jgi:signal transduction protein with GAF and PtsI domain
MRDPSDTPDAQVLDIIGLSEFLELRDDFDTCLQELAELVARTLQTNNCSIMLLKENSQQNGKPQLRLSAHCGNLPIEAYQTTESLFHGIAGKVAATGSPLLVKNISDSEFAGLASRSSDADGGFISAPLVVDKQVIGVINANSPQDKRVFETRDLDLVTVLSLYIGKSIQAIQLKRLLKSKFAIAALAKEESAQQVESASFTQEPEKVAKILAKSFFNDMKQAGLGPDHILKAATEIIDQLHSTLKKHKERQARSK